MMSCDDIVSSVVVVEFVCMTSLVLNVMSL